MPTYSYLNKETNEEFDVSMTIAEMHEFESNHKDTYERILKPIAFGDPVLLGVTRNPTSFNDLVKEIKKNNYGSNINNRNGEI